MPGRSHFNLFIKDTRELFMLCILCFVPVIYLLSLLVIYLILLIIHYLFICARCSLLSFIYFVHCLTFYSFCCSILFSSILLLSLFIVHCSKEKSLILILDCIPGILILRTTLSMQVNKHHTADCTDFVLV